MQILELLVLINGLKKCKWTSLCTWYVIFALFTHIFYISKTDKILPFFSQFSCKFLQHFWGNRFTCMNFYPSDAFGIMKPLGIWILCWLLILLTLKVKFLKLSTGARINRNKSLLHISETSTLTYDSPYSASYIIFFSILWRFNFFLVNFIWKSFFPHVSRHVSLFRFLELKFDTPMTETKHVWHSEYVFLPGNKLINTMLLHFIVLFDNVMRQGT